MEFIYSTKNPSVPTAYSSLDAMHTQCEILLPFLEEDVARALVGSVWDLVREADRRYNRFLPGSALAEVNRKAAGEAVEVDEELFFILQMCETFRKATLGYFDISAGSRVPERAVILDTSAHTVRFSRPGMRLDLGGFVKGFVLEKAVRMVSEVAKSALLSFGGSSVAAVGRHPLGGGEGPSDTCSRCAGTQAPWPVSVAHPYYTDRTAHTFSLEDAAWSMSGKDPHGRGHIIDPTTGNTLEKEGLVAVTGPSAMVTEALSTALWVAPAERRGEILAAFDGYQAWEILCRTDGQALTMSL